MVNHVANGPMLKTPAYLNIVIACNYLDFYAHVPLQRLIQDMQLATGLTSCKELKVSQSLLVSSSTSLSAGSNQVGSHIR